MGYNLSIEVGHLAGKKKRSDAMGRMVVVVLVVVVRVGPKAKMEQGLSRCQCAMDWSISQLERPFPSCFADALPWGRIEAFGWKFASCKHQRILSTGQSG